MSVKMQEQSQRTEAASSNGAHPVEDVVARPAGLPEPEAATVIAEAPAPAARRRPALLTRRVLLPVLAVVLIVVALFGFNAYREGQLYVSTANPQLTRPP